MRKEEFYFDSRDNVNRIHAVKYLPDTENVIGVVQIIHGMAEYVERYEELARYLTDKNFVVVGEDHLGHGKSVGENGKQGYFCPQDPATVLVRDSHRLKKLTQEQYPGVPYFIVGHSMGSFMLRNYMAKYGTGIDGAIVMDTGMQPGFVTTAGKLVAHVQKLFCGAKHTSKLLDKLVFGSYNKRINPLRTSSDWLSRDEAAVDKYLADPDCGFIFTINGFLALFELIGRAGKAEYIEKIPKQLPVLVLGGDQDPVGDYGEGTKKFFDAVKDAGVEDVELKLYQGSRHEILNDLDKELVKKDIYQWILNQMSKKAQTNE